jgi:hypothetical protein
MSLRSLSNGVLRTLKEPPAAPGRRLLLYYSGLLAIAVGLAALPPGVKGLPISDHLAAAAPDVVSSLRFDLQMLAAMLAAIALMVPTVWVYTASRRSRGYEQAVVQTMLILPLAVAGIVMVVQNSLALAFSLAGVVAAVRFRSTLKDTSDMLYIFLAIAVGIAVGVQAVAAAAILSATFNLVTMAIWQCGYEACPLTGQARGRGSTGRRGQALADRRDHAQEERQDGAQVRGATRCGQAARTGPRHPAQPGRSSRGRCHAPLGRQ